MVTQFGNYFYSNNNNSNNQRYCSYPPSPAKRQINLVYSTHTQIQLLTKTETYLNLNKEVYKFNNEVNGM